MRFRTDIRFLHCARPGRACAALVAVLCPPILCLALALPGCRPASTTAPTTASDSSVAPLPAHATYVGDAGCSTCHAEAADAYQGTAHHRSLSRFDPATAPERFDGETEVCNPASNFCYEAFVEDGNLYQREFRRDGDGTVVHERIHRAAYVIGSGHATRSYLMDVNGYLTEMPLTWYVERQRWGMSPGYDEANDRFGRKINLECMTCHNAVPEHSPFTQNHYPDVPLGITCERCHGPASTHVELHRSDAPADEPDPIVNPAHLDREAQLSVCQQCHLAGIAVFAPEADPTTFRPGQLLRANRTVFVPEKQLTDPDWVGIDSHPIRLARSACFQQSAMTCTTCHDPHRPAAALSAADYNASCQSCHRTGDDRSLCTRPEATTPQAAMQGNCVSCHMQRGGTSDVPHVTFTDHWIRRRPGPPRDPAEGRPSFDTPDPLTLVPLRRMDRLTRPSDADRDHAEAAIAYFRFYETMHRHPAYLDHTIEHGRAALAQATDHVEARIALARALAEADSLDAAAAVMQAAATAAPNNAWVHYWHGAMDEARGQTDAALRAYERALAIQPKMVEAQIKLAGALFRARRLDEAYNRLETLIALDSVHAPRAWFNLGVIRMQTGDTAAAREAFTEAARLDPDLAPAHLQLGRIAAKEERHADAVRHLRRAIIADPQDPAAYGMLGVLYLQQGQADAARRLFERVLQLDPDNEHAQALLKQLRR